MSRYGNRQSELIRPRYHIEQSADPTDRYSRRCQQTPDLTNWKNSVRKTRSPRSDCCCPRNPMKLHHSARCSDRLRQVPL